VESFGISKFKSFASKQTVPVKPITLVYGANSAGKSSIIQGFLLIDHMMKTAECDMLEIQTAWDTLDLGGFKQFAYKHKYEDELAFGISLKNNVQIQLTIKAETDDLGKLTNDPAFISSLHLFQDRKSIIKFVKNSPKNDVAYKVSSFNEENQDWIDYYESKAEKPIAECSIDSEMVKSFFFDFYTFANAHVFGKYNFNSFKSCFYTSAFELSEDLKILRDYLSLVINDIWAPIWDTKNDDQQRNNRSRVNYIGPLRDYPPRVISNEHDYEKMKDHTWSILLRDENVRKKVNNWLGKEFMHPKYKFEVEKKVEPNEVIELLLEFFQEIDIQNGYVPKELQSIIDIEMNHDTLVPSPKLVLSDMFGTKESNEFIEKLLNKTHGTSVYKKLQLIDQRAKISVSLRDVGVGISQVLPVLVNAYSPESNVIAIEQPEIHLHPKLQSELADVFMETALGEEKKTYIIETHSEHLLLRIMRRIRETTSGDLPADKTPIKADDVQILFVMPSQNNEGSIVKKIALDEEGEMIDVWPGGFFEEGFNERFSI
jgi:predicted ATPase